MAETARRPEVARQALARLARSPRVLAAGTAVVLLAGGLVAVRALNDSATLPVRTATVTRGSVLKTVTLAGTVAPVAQLRLGFRVPGRLAAVNASVGQRVSAEQPLALLDTTDLRVAVDQARAALALAQARYDQTVSGATAQDLAIARQAVENARRALDETQRTGANDIATADLALARLKTNYLQARVNLGTYVDGLTSELGQLQLDVLTGYVETARTDLNTALPPDPTPNPVSGILTPPVRIAADGFAAQSALGQARASVNNASLTNVGALRDALGEYGAAAGAALDTASVFDRLLSESGDTGPASASALATQARYSTAAARLGVALELLAAQLAAAQTAMTTAQGSLEDAASRGTSVYSAARADVTLAISSLMTALEHLTAARAKQAVAGPAATLVSDAVGGSYVAAQQNVATVRERTVASVVAGQNAFASANASLAKVAAGARQSDLDAASAALDAAKTAVDAAETNLASATLRAPVAGVVSAVNGRAGEVASAAGVTLIVLSDTSAFMLRGFVGEAEISAIEPGQTATVSVEALALASPLNGTVTSVDPAATLQQGAPTYGIEVTIQSQGARVRAGMSGTALITVASKEGVLVVPTAALRGRGARQTVQVVGETTPRDVEIGISDETVAEVVSGLSEGDRVTLASSGARR